MRWLYDGEEPIKAHKESPTALHTHDKFGQRFSAILDLAEFSNVRFGKLLSIDPSYMHSWLFLSEDNTVSSFVVGMVDQIGSFSADIIKPPMSFETATEKTALSDNQPLYHGMAGLQTAVLRFL